MTQACPPPSPSRAPRAQRGFVLPYVLATIAILSLIAVLGANTLRAAQVNLRRLDSHDQLRIALADAEAIVLDTFLTSTVVRQGLYLGARQTGVDFELEFGGGEAESDLDETLVWNAVGGVRALEIDGVGVSVAYQDAGGLVSLYSSDPSLVDALLQTLAGAGGSVDQLAAKLGDFVDADDTRRFTGGERADYRMARRPAPTNSPVRSWAELGAVLGWAEQPFYRDRSLLNYITFFPGSSSPRVAGMTTSLAATLTRDQRRVREVEDPLSDSGVVSSLYPTPRARFTLTAISPDGASGLRRIIEAERTAGAPDFAVARRLIAEYPLSPVDLEPLDLDALPALVAPPPGRPQQ